MNKLYVQDGQFWPVDPVAASEQAVVAKRHHPILRACAERLAQRGLCKMPVVVAVRRKLRHLVCGILKSGQPFDPHQGRSQR